SLVLRFDAGFLQGSRHEKMRCRLASGGLDARRSNRRHKAGGSPGIARPAARLVSPASGAERQGPQVGGVVGGLAARLASTRLCIASASCDFLRAARLGWMTRRAAALSSFLAVRLYSV